MDETPHRGRLSDFPFPRILGEIWKKGLTGTLLVRTSADSKSFTFEKGSLVLDRPSFAEDDFLRSLMTDGIMDLISLARCEETAEKNDISSIRAILESRLISPGCLWSLLESFVRKEALDLFGWKDGEYEFESRPELTGPLLLWDISLPDLILEGIRGLEEPTTFENQLPPESERLQIHSPHLRTSLDLAPHEVYLLKEVGGTKTIADILADSDLGREDTQRVLFSFFCLGLVGTAEAKTKSGKTSAEISLSDLDRIFKTFNTKCSLIFKYVAKEIGPVAFSIIEKSLDEIKGRLDPAFRGSRLLEDGRIELKSPLKMNMSFAAEETRAGLLRSMDEILMAEVLAVKRTLGQDHESALVRSLEKIGDSS